MGIAIKFASSTVMHARLGPKKNKFFYRVPYFQITHSNEKKPWSIACNRFGPWSFMFREYGYKNVKNPLLWAQEQFNQHGLTDVTAIKLITQLRTWGIGFNPISFYCGFRADNRLRAVLCEVKNTFKGVHWYLIQDEDGITQTKSYKAEKQLFVSPFYELAGFYRFVFHVEANIFHARIDYFPDQNDSKKPFFTFIKADFRSISAQNLLLLSLFRPWLGLRTLFLIHVQAVKLFFKGLRLKKIPSHASADLPAKSCAIKNECGKFKQK